MVEWRHARPSTEGPPRRPGRRRLPGVRRTRRRTRRPRAGDAAARRGHRPRTRSSTRRPADWGRPPTDRAADLNAAFADPGHPRDRRDDRRRRPDHRHPPPRRRAHPCGPEAVPRLQRQHEPARLAVAAGSRRRSTAARRRCIWARARASTPTRPRRCGRRCSTASVLELTEPGESEDFGLDWGDPRALTDGGERGPTEPWTWAGPATSVTGATWGGCLEVDPVDPHRRPRSRTTRAVLDGGVLLARDERGAHSRARSSAASCAASANGECSAP